MQRYTLPDPRFLPLGRHDANETEASLWWSGSGVRVRASCTRMEAEITSTARDHAAYLGVLMDGAPVLRFPLTAGTHRYPILAGLDRAYSHEVTLIRDTQPSYDEDGPIVLHAVSLDGEAERPAERPLLIEFIGDSLTVGEGCLGPQSGEEWRMIWISHLPAFPTLVAEQMNAEKRVIALGGWGVSRSWDNQEESRIGRIYDQLCAITPGGGVPAPAEKGAQAVVINLGTNDASGMKLLAEKDMPKAREMLRERVKELIGQARRRNPDAVILWAYGLCGTEAEPWIRAAVEEAAQADGGRIRYLSLTPAQSLGSRGHPSRAAHRKAAEEITAALKAMLESCHGKERQKKTDVEEKYLLWRRQADQTLRDALCAMERDESAKEDAFYRDLSFGTGGLRGVIGPGTNRMNVHTVAKASQGLADYVVRRFPEDQRRIAVSYDSRILSDEFARVASSVFAGNGITAFLYPELMPTPCLSFAVRALSCAAGIMVTASHTPAKYNGYKVYGPDGCQITTEAAEEILGEIEKLDVFSGPKRLDFAKGLETGLIRYIPDQVYTDFVEEVKKQSLLGDETVDKNVAIVYSPLNGTGLKPVLRTLRESGYTNVSVVKEQENPDGRFPTCPYPNPEIREAMQLGLEYAQRLNADLLLATDPDCDRCGIAVKNENGQYQLLSGNETGMLLFDYVCSRRIALGRMPKKPVLVKTIVTADMAQRIADKYGVETVNVLTGFKFIGETIGRLEAEGEKDRYIFGFEESYGYLSGTYVRDKDAVNAAFLICEMFAWYKKQGVSLLQKLNALYAEYGYCLNTLHSYEFDGAAGFEKMQRIMAAFRGGVQKIGDRAVETLLDYAPGLDGLPRSDVLKFLLSGGASAVVRPSGTEPKLKLYISVSAKDQPSALKAEKILSDDLSRFMQ